MLRRRARHALCVIPTCPTASCGDEYGNGGLYAVARRPHRTACAALYVQPGHGNDDSVVRRRVARADADRDAVRRRAGESIDAVVEGRWLLTADAAILAPADSPFGHEAAPRSADWTA